MSQELSLSGSISYSDSEGTDDSLSISAFIANVAAKVILHTKQIIPTSEAAINIGDLPSLGFAIFVNRDDTNYINLKVATGGAIFAKLRPGAFAIQELGSGAQVPYAIANTASCSLEIFIVAV